LDTCKNWDTADLRVNDPFTITVSLPRNFGWRDGQGGNGQQNIASSYAEQYFVTGFDFFFFTEYIGNTKHVIHELLQRT
jgi:hypothetical protein